MSNLPITGGNYNIGPIPTPTTGWDNGIYKVNYPQIEALRIKTWDVSNFINLLRDEQGIYNVFENILPPKITTGPIRTGCVKLPDPGCLSSYTFAAAMDKERIIDEVTDPCSQAMLGRLMAQYIESGVARWALDEAKNVFNYVGSVVGTPTDVDPTQNIRVTITDAILDLEQKLYEELGDLAPTREEFMVLVSRNAENILASQQFVCCNWNMVDIRQASPLANLFGVKEVVALPLNLMPAGYDVIVYVPKFLFLKTMCNTGFQTITNFNAPGYQPNSTRFFAREKFGFAQFEFPVDNDGDGVYSNNSVVALTAGVGVALVTPTP